MREYHLPVKIMDLKGVTAEENLFVNKGLYAVYDDNVENWKNLTKIEGKGSYIIFDFGKEMHGNVRIFTGLIYYGSCKVRIRFGESYGEVNSSIGEKNATNDHSPRDFETLLCTATDISWGQTGFRFIRIDLLEDKFVYLKNVFCENIIFSKKPIYTYQGKDERIKDIFSVAKRTVDLCASSGYIWDGIKRDRLIWVGDLAPEIMALTTMYGRLPVIERTLTVARKLAPLPNFMNRICNYSMWWFIILADYYKDFKCKDFIQKNLKYAQGLIDVFDSIVDEKGNLKEGFRYLVDWPTVNSVDENVGNKVIFIMALNSATYLFEEFGICTKKIGEIKDRIMLQPLDVVEKKQVVALKYFALGEISDKEYQILVEGRAKGLSTFMSYYILTAIASRDEKLAIEIMKEYYGAMLDMGATTFWEDFNIDWVEGSAGIDKPCGDKKDIHGDFGAHCYVGFRHSLCHGWSAGVIKFIKEHC